MFQDVAQCVINIFRRSLFFAQPVLDFDWLKPRTCMAMCFVELSKV